MITKQTEQNSQKYKSLFEEATLALLSDESEYNPDTAISDLSTYFSHLSQLVELKKSNPEKFKNKFIILPVDEELFEINANTRQITVPETFKKCAGVAGDQAAEIIYFSIDRYFDTMDLNNQRIHIEWIGPMGDEGVSEELIRDLEIIPGKIVFGWALHEDIMKDPGQVEFAVRFWNYADDNETINYTLRTLPQKITISQGINVDNVGSDNVFSTEEQSFIFDRIVKSQVGPSAKLPEKPTILEMYYSIDDKDIKDITTPELINSIDLVSSPTGNYKIYLNAFSSDGILSYRMFNIKYPTESIYLNAATDLTLVPTRDEVFKEKNDYWFENGTRIADYMPGDSIEEYPLGKVFEKMAIYNLNNGKTGTYQIEVINKVGIEKNQTYTMEFNKKAPADPTALWNFSNIDYVPVLFPKKNVVVNPETPEQVNDEEQVATVLLGLGDDAQPFTQCPEEITSYQWYQGIAKDNVNQIVDGATEKALEVNEKELVNGEKYYKIHLTNTLNGTSQEGTKVRLFRVTEYPKAFNEDNLSMTIVPYEGSPVITMAGQNVTFSVSTDKSKIASDSFTLRAFYKNKASDGDDTYIEKHRATIETKTYSYKIEESGYYKFELINHLNGQLSDTYQTIGITAV